MHWTVALLLCICTACAALNVAQWRTVGTVRVSGMLVCAFWGIQQGFWAITGDDSIILFLWSDMLLILWFLTEGTADWSDRIIAALIPPTTACVLFAWSRGGATTESYWLNISMVAAQMLLGLPRNVPQRALGSFSHGSSKRQGVQNVGGA